MRAHKKNCRRRASRVDYRISIVMACLRSSVFLAFLLTVWLGLASAGTEKPSRGKSQQPVMDLSEKTIKNYLEDQKIKVDESPPKTASPLELYLHLLRLKRREQVEAVEKVATLTDYTQQYKAVSLLLEALFPELKDAMAKIEMTGFLPGMPFPEKRDVQEEIGKVYENVLMFGDFVLRIPDTTKKVYEGHREWAGMFRWALKFCLESRNVFSGPYLTHINLMMQELGLGPRDPNFVNPFSKKYEGRLRTGEELEKEQLLTRREAMKEKMKKGKGPRLQNNRHHNEL